MSPGSPTWPAGPRQSKMFLSTHIRVAPLPPTCSLPYPPIRIQFCHIRPRLSTIYPTLITNPPISSIFSFTPILDLYHSVEAFLLLQLFPHIGPVTGVLHGNYPAMPALHWRNKPTSFNNRNPSTRRCRLVLPPPTPLPTRITIAVLASFLSR